MKRKIGFVAAVILVGAFVVACNQKPTEPTATPAPSPTPAATEKPATSDLPSDAVIIEDTSLAQPVNQEVVDHGPSNEGATYETDAELEQKISAQGEQWIQDMMNKWGISREEAEQAYNESAKRGQQAAAEEQERIAERNKAYEEFAEKDAQRVKEKADAHYYERYGISADEALGMSSEELCRLFMQKHGG